MQRLKQTKTLFLQCDWDKVDFLDNTHLKSYARFKIWVVAISMSQVWDGLMSQCGCLEERVTGWMVCVENIYYLSKKGYFHILSFFWRHWILTSLNVILVTVLMQYWLFFYFVKKKFKTVIKLQEVAYIFYTFGFNMVCSSRLPRISIIPVNKNLIRKFHWLMQCSAFLFLSIQALIEAAMCLAFADSNWKGTFTIHFWKIFN